MITAKEAKQMTIGNQDNYTVEEYIAKIERKIKEEVQRGCFELYVSFKFFGAPSKATVKILKKELKRAGYRVSQYSNDAMTIKWK
jgi:hypothetical protein